MVDVHGVVVPEHVDQLRAVMLIRVLEKLLRKHQAVPDDVQIGLRDRFSAVPEPDAHDGNECGVLDLFDVGLLLNAEALMTEKSEQRASEILCPWDNRSPPIGCIQ